MSRAQPGSFMWTSGLSTITLLIILCMGIPLQSYHKVVSIYGIMIKCSKNTDSVKLAGEL